MKKEVAFFLAAMSAMVAGNSQYTIGQQKHTNKTKIQSKEKAELMLAKAKQKRERKAAKKKALSNNKSEC